MIKEKIRNLHYKKLFLYGVYNTIIVLTFFAAIIDFLIDNRVDSIIDIFFCIIAWIFYKTLCKKGDIINATIALFWLAIIVQFVLLEIHSVDFNIIFAIFIPIIAYISMPKKLIVLNLTLFYILLTAYLSYNYFYNSNNIFLHTTSYLIAYILAHFFILSFGLFYYLAIEESMRRLEESNKTKEMLLNEVHHRVKNNLNLVASILGLNANSINNTQTKDFLQSNQKRIESMAILHEILYKEHSASSADLTHYVNKLASHILKSMAQKDVIINCDLEHLNLPMDSMIQLGIILNEMLTNSIKHKNSEHKLTINILFKKCDNNYCLGYCDNSKLDDLKTLKQGFGYRLCYKLLLKKGW